MLFVYARKIRLHDGKGFFEEECFQLTFDSGEGIDCGRTGSTKASTDPYFLQQESSNYTKMRQNARNPSHQVNGRYWTACNTLRIWFFSVNIWNLNNFQLQWLSRDPALCPYTRWGFWHCTFVIGLRPTSLPLTANFPVPSAAYGWGYHSLQY